jgi:voltage-gated potassium channel
MHRTKIFIFGYSKRSVFLTKSLHTKEFRITIVVSSQEEYDSAKKEGFMDVITIDMTDDTQLLSSLHVEPQDDLVCVMDDSHFNVFLTLSLHALYPQNRIIALSDSFHTTQKLKMAGASKVIDLYQVSSNRIYNILNKPVATRFIDSLLSFEDDLSLREIIIPENSFLDEIMVDDFDFSIHKIILIGMVDRRLSEQFLFITSGIEHRLDRGDVLVCMGYSEDLDRFEEFILEKK